MFLEKIKNAIVAILKGIYSLLSLLNLQFTAIVALIGVVLHFTGVMDKGGAVLLIYCVVFIASIVLAVLLTFKKIFNIEKKPKEKSKVQIVKGQNETEQQIAQPQVSSNKVADVNQLQNQNATGYSVLAEEKPVYYQVKQNKNYIMAEYSDRYELYLKTAKGLKKIRTDYKNWPKDITDDAILFFRRFRKR